MSNSTAIMKWQPPPNTTYVGAWLGYTPTVHTMTGDPNIYCLEAHWFLRFPVYFGIAIDCDARPYSRSRRGERKV